MNFNTIGLIESNIYDKNNKLLRIEHYKNQLTDEGKSILADCLMVENKSLDTILPTSGWVSNIYQNNFYTITNNTASTDLPLLFNSANVTNVNFNNTNNFILKMPVALTINRFKLTKSSGTDTGSQIQIYGSINNIDYILITTIDAAPTNIDSTFNNSIKYIYYKFVVVNGINNINKIEIFNANQKGLRRIYLSQDNISISNTTTAANFTNALACKRVLNDSEDLYSDVGYMNDLNGIINSVVFNYRYVNNSGSTQTLIRQGLFETDESGNNKRLFSILSRNTVLNNGDYLIDKYKIIVNY